MYYWSSQHWELSSPPAISDGQLVSLTRPENSSKDTKDVEIQITFACCLLDSDHPYAELLQSQNHR